MSNERGIVKKTKMATLLGKFYILENCPLNSLFMRYKFHLKKS
jgi:hypothetical protein